MIPHVLQPEYPTMRAPNLRTPGLVEVIVGSILSVVLGALLAATILIVKPVEVLKEPPKEVEPGKVYYFAGSKDWNAGQRWRFKRDAFMAGHTVEVTEDELNAWIESIYPQLAVETRRPAPKGKDGKPRAKKPSEGADDPPIQTGSPNFRLMGDSLKIGVTYYVNLFGWWSFSVVTQTEGTLVKPKKGDEPVYFQPSTLYVGSLPVHKLLVVRPIVFSQMVNCFEFPQELADQWAKCRDVKVEKRQLVLQMAE